jgi:hypothetical protein
MKKSMWIGVVVVGSALGCAQEPLQERRIDDSNDVTDREPVLGQRVGDLFSGDSFVHAVGGRLEGAVGPATGLAHDAQYIDFYLDPMYTSGNITVEGETGSAMGIFSLSGDMNDMEIGEGDRTCMDDYEDPNSDINTGEGVAASFTGCANTGSPEDGWSYDAPADCTDVVVVEPTPEAPEDTVVTLSFLAHWGPESGGGQERTVKATIHLTE